MNIRLSNKNKLFIIEYSVETHVFIEVFIKKLIIINSEIIIYFFVLDYLI